MSENRQWCPQWPIHGVDAIKCNCRQRREVRRISLSHGLHPLGGIIGVILFRAPGQGCILLWGRRPSSVCQSRRSSRNLTATASMPCSLDLASDTAMGLCRSRIPMLASGCKSSVTRNQANSDQSSAFRTSLKVWNQQHAAFARARRAQP